MELTDRQKDLQKQLDLPQIDQIGMVVPDIQAAMADYAPLFGPWMEMENEFDAEYRGQQHRCKIKMAFGKTGDLEIELIEPVEGVSPHTEFLDSGRSGMHHIRYRVDDVETRMAMAREIGYEVIWYKRFSEDMAFCYMEKPGDPLMIEFLQMQGGY